MLSFSHLPHLPFPSLSSVSHQSFRRCYALPARPRVGWIGLGVMGNPMAGHILAADYPVTVYTRTKSKAAQLIDKGAVWADSPSAVARESDVVFSIVGYPQDVEEVILGENGVLTGLSPSGVIVDMTTSRPSLAVTIASEAEKKGCVFIDAPVSGGDVGARNGKLSIMVGGDEGVVTSLNPLFSLLGTAKYTGESGSGQHTKLANQIMISGTMIGMVESLLYAQRAGLDEAKTIEILSGGSASNWSLANYGPRILRGDYHPGFFVEHFVKDMSIAIEEANGMGLSLPGLDLVHRLYTRLMEVGLDKLGTQSLMLVLAEMNKTHFNVSSPETNASISAAMKEWNSSRQVSTENSPLAKSFRLIRPSPPK